MSVEIAWKQNMLVTDFHLLKSLLVVFGFGSQAFICGFSRQNICSVFVMAQLGLWRFKTTLWYRLTTLVFKFCYNILFNSIFKSFIKNKQKKCPQNIWLVTLLSEGLCTLRLRAKNSMQLKSSGSKLSLCSCVKWNICN